MYHIDLSNEAITLTKWLVSIPSVSRSKGVAVAIKAIFDGIGEFGYFKKFPNNLSFITHKDQQNNSLIAYIQAPNNIKNTLLLICSIDTTAPDKYGSLKPYAFKSDELMQKLSELKIPSDIKEIIEQNSAVFGLGCFESKAAAGSMISTIKYLSDKSNLIESNILFVCTSETYNEHVGIKECMGYIEQIVQSKNLDLKLALSAAPNIKNSIDDDNLHVYTSNLGLVEPSFYILGQDSNMQTPFAGFSPTIIASLIIKNFELNCQKLKHLSSFPLSPSFKTINYKQAKNNNTPESVQLSFNLPFKDLNLTYLIEELKLVAASAIEESSNLIDSRESVYKDILKLSYPNIVKQAEVLSYSDLFNRASKNYKGDLISAIEGLILKCSKDGLDRHETASAIIERLNDLCHLPKPSIIVYLGDNFIPQQGIQANNKNDREIIMTVDKIIDQVSRNCKITPTIADVYGPTDACFFKPIALSHALRALTVNCPIPCASFSTLKVPAITIGLKGKDLSLPTECIDISMFNYLPSFILSSMDAIGNINKDTKINDFEQSLDTNLEFENKKSFLKKAVYLFEKNVEKSKSIFHLKDKILSDEKKNNDSEK